MNDVLYLVILIDVTQNTRWLNQTLHILQQYKKDLLLKHNICNLINHFLSTVHREQEPEPSPFDTPEQQRKRSDSKMVRYWSWRSDIRRTLLYQSLVQLLKLKQVNK